MIDKNKLYNIQKVAILFYDTNKQYIEYDESNIDGLIKQSCDFLRLEIDNEEKSIIKKNIMMQCQIKHSYDGAMITDNYEHYNWYDEAEKNLDHFYWSRYRNYLLNDKNFGLNIVNKLEKETLRDLMNFIGDPKSDCDFKRRGLIIGDVQSGKTSTYTGLICKAADAGYKVIILLTGTIESLRKQTQQRIEEGFVGANIDELDDGISKNIRVGVGKDGQPIRVTVLTSRENDFVGNKNKIITSIENNKVVLFVVKKNTTVLNKLIKWLIELNADYIDNKIHFPMLLIDDEADNASINTKKEDEEPTAVNKCIRKLIDVFTQSNYVGFTATPFANVFINPKTSADMENEDLFPENFIYCLPTPDNYIGASRIFGFEGDLTKSLVYIKDAGMIQEDGYSFYCKHKKDWNDKLPNSLNDAVYAFLLVNAIRDLRDNKNEHRTMLINLSRFINVQKIIKYQVEDIFNQAYREIKFNLNHNIDNTKSNYILRKIYNVFSEQYSNLEFSWDEIVDVLLESIEPIQIKVVNSSKNSEKLDYERDKENGLRIIAIGGLALSRGLTLEGLVISYFFRSTATYDVLMQMGRWFGYRNNYADLMRIWVGEKSAGWYAEISEATEELKHDIARMNDMKLTPKDFGIKVRNDSNELGITAANKMRSASTALVYYSYFGNLIQAPYIDNNKDINEKNIETINKLIDDSIKNGHKLVKEKYKNTNVLLGVDKENILSFFSSFKLSNYNSRFDTKDIYSYLISHNDKILDKWDVAFVEGDGVDYNLYDNIKIKTIKRNGIVNSNRISFSKNAQLISPTDAIHCLNSAKEKESAENQYKSYYKKENGKEFTSSQTYPGKIYFEYIEKRNPLLLVYFIHLVENETNKEILNKFGDTPFVSLAMGIPKSGDHVSVPSIYKGNRIYFETEEEE